MSDFSVYFMLCGLRLRIFILGAEEGRGRGPGPAGKRERRALALAFGERGQGRFSLRPWGDVDPRSERVRLSGPSE